MSRTIAAFALVFVLGATCAGAALWDLDPTFGSGGLAAVGLRAASESPEALVRQADGKLIVAGPGFGNIAVARFNTDGTLDPSFGDGGAKEIDLGSNERTTALALQSDGKVLIAGWIDQTLLDEFFVLRLLPNGQIDAGFGTGGVVQTVIGASDAQASAIAVQPDDRIVVAGRAGVEVAVARYLADGSPDPSFGGGDGVITAAAGDAVWANDVALQSDGKVVVAGCATSSPFAAYDFALMRFDADGDLDTGFGLGGVVLTDVASGNDCAEALLVDSGGRLVAAGSALVSGSYLFGVIRYSSDGTLDSSFDGDGIALTAIGTTAAAYSLALQSDGKLITGGSSYDGSRSIMTLARYADDGTLDSSFDTDGVLTLGVGGEESNAIDVLVEPGGSIVAATGAAFYADLDFALVRVDTDGILDPSFDVDGIASTTVGASGEAPYALALQSDGKLVVAGASGANAMVARVNPDGSLDTTFGRGGGVTSKCGGTSGCVLHDVAIQPDGKIVAAGERLLSGGRFVLLRYDSDGNPDASFGTNGLAVGPTGIANALKLQPDGKLIAAGYDNVLGGRVVVARFNPDGSPDSSFDGDGVAETSLGGLSIMWGAALQPDGKIVVAGGQPGWSLVRYDSDGSLDTSFDGDGIVFTAAQFSAFGVAIEDDGKIVAAGGAGDFTVVRYNSDGSIDSSFGVGGSGIAELPGLGSARDVILQPDGKLLLVGSSDRIAVARLNSDGNPDPTFGVRGVIKTALGEYSEAWSIALQPDGRAVVAGRTNNDELTLVRYEMSGCGAAPASPCRSAGKSKVLVTDSGNDDNDRLIWKWLEGEATSVQELANPTIPSGGLEEPAYRLCVYGAGAPVALTVPPDHLLWRETGERGFRYKDTAGLNDGAFGVLLRAGAADKAKVVFKARGAGMPDIVPPLASPVTVQLVNNKSGICWESVFDAGDVLVNQPGKFKAIDVP